ncbi:hypothetical protein ES707_03380 [subsurface metagenome]
MNLVDSWILMWGLTYITASFIKPDLTKSVFNHDVSKLGSAVIMFIVGSTILLSLYLNMSLLYVILGFSHSFMAVANFCGVLRWNIPWKNKGLPHLVMAILDATSAVCLFNKIEMNS